MKLLAWAVAATAACRVAAADGPAEPLAQGPADAHQADHSEPSRQLTPHRQQPSHMSPAPRAHEITALHAVRGWPSIESNLQVHARGRCLGTGVGADLALVPAVLWLSFERVLM